MAQMRYEYDRAVEQLKEGRGGLEQYRGLVERVTRQAQTNRGHVQKLEAVIGEQGHGQRFRHCQKIAVYCHS